MHYEYYKKLKLGYGISLLRDYRNWLSPQKSNGFSVMVEYS